MIRDESRSEKIQNLISLPKETNGEDEEEEINELKTMIKKTKEENYSFVNELNKIKEFHNSQNLDKIINHYKINEKSSNLPLNTYNPEEIYLIYLKNINS